MLTMEEAIRNIRFFMQKYLPFRPDVEEGSIKVFIGTAQTLKLGVEYAYKDFIDFLPSDVGFYSNAFPGYEFDAASFADPIAYGHSIPADLIVDFYYPDASVADRTTLIASLHNGDIDHYDFLHGWTAVAPQSEHPSAEEVLYAIHAAGHGDPVLPEIDLGFEGVSAAELDFLVGVYVAALGRAPEHEGLAYWASQLADELEKGTSTDDAFKLLARLMHASGTHNGETATHLENAAYVSHLYASTLGREPDPAGQAYWTAHFEDGGARSEFIAVLLASALQSEGDDAYLTARIAVAKYVAQYSISYEAGRIDLVSVLDGVYNSATAWGAIMDAANGVFSELPLELGRGDTLADDGQFIGDFMFDGPETELVAFSGYGVSSDLDGW